MRERKEHPSHISALLSKTAKKFKFHDDMSAYRVWKRWANIAGETLARHTEPVRLKRGKLVICVEHPAWMQEVGFIKQALLEKIRKDFSYLNIKDICFELGRLNPSKTIPEQKPEYKLTEDEKEFIGQALNEITDPDIRDAARKAMEKMFGNRKIRYLSP